MAMLPCCGLPPATLRTASQLLEPSVPLAFLHGLSQVPTQLLVPLNRRRSWLLPSVPQCSRSGCYTAQSAVGVQQEAVSWGPWERENEQCRGFLLQQQ